MYSIKETASQLHVTYDTLRYYEKIGLLTDIVRNPSGQRLYSEENVTRLSRILHLRHLGASVDETQQILDLFEAEVDSAETYDEAILLLTRLEDETNSRIEELKQQQVYLQQKREKFEQIKLSLKQAL